MTDATYDIPESEFDRGETTPDDRPRRPPGRPRKMPGQRRFTKGFPSDESLTQRAAEGAPRRLADVPQAQRCICKSLAAWARPCGACR